MRSRVRSHAANKNQQLDSDDVDMFLNSDDEGEQRLVLSTDSQCKGGLVVPDMHASISLVNNIERAIGLPVTLDENMSESKHSGGSSDTAAATPARRTSSSQPPGTATATSVSGSAVKLPQPGHGVASSLAGPPEKSDKTALKWSRDKAGKIAAAIAEWEGDKAALESSFSLTMKLISRARQEVPWSHSWELGAWMILQKI